MCSIANLFDINIRTFDAKKTWFFCPEWLDCVNHYEKLIFLRNKISLLEVELWGTSGSCCKHIIGGKNIYLYGCVSVYWSLSVLRVCVCDIKIRVPVKNHTVSDLSKLDTLLHKTYIKVLLVLWYQGSTCVDPYYHYVK